MNRFLALLAAAVIAIGTVGCGGGGTSADPLGTDSLTFGYKSTTTDSDWVTAPQVNTNGTVVLTARVTNASGKAVVGREVSFGFVSHTGGGSLNSESSAGATVGIDVVRASISNGASMIVNIVVGGGGTDGRLIALQGSATSLPTGQSSILTATVTNGSGDAIVGATVSFSIATNNSGATLSVLNGGKTDAVGRAMAIYTAGATSGVQDMVLAQISGVATAPPLTLTIPSATATASTKTVALTATTVSLAAGENSILTSKVTDGSGNPISGQTVTFRFLGGVAAPSGATLTILNGGVTDASGQALAVYTAGSNTPTANLQDVVEASVTGASGAVLITRAAGSGVGTADYISYLSPSVSTVSAGQMSVITATVRHEGEYGETTSPQTITFTIPVNNSGASFIDSTGAIVSTITIPMQLDYLSWTDISVTYKAGTNVSGTEVEDMIQAVLGNGSTSAVLITRTSSTSSGASGYHLALSADSTSMTANQSAVVTATVTDGSNNPVSGQTVTFALLTDNSGATFTTVNGTTDSSGTAVAVYKAGTTGSSTVQDVVQAAIPGSAGALVMTRTVAGSSGGATGFSISVAPVDVTIASIGAGELSVIVATVKNANGSVAVGQTVTFGFLGGTAPSGATLTLINGGVTDPNGEAWAVYTAGATNPTQNIQDVVQASVTGAAGATIVTRQAAAQGNRFDYFQTDPSTTVAQRLSAYLPAPVNCMLKAKVTSSGLGATVPQPVVGETVTFTILRGPGKFDGLATKTALTDTNGEAYIYFDQPVPAPVTTTDPGPPPVDVVTNFETIVRATIPVSLNAPKGGDAIVIVYW
jgi:hypothetical protein